MVIPSFPTCPKLNSPFTAAEAIATFQDAFQWFFDSLVEDRLGMPVERPSTERFTRKKIRMERVKSFLNFCGNPEQQFPAIHVAGTSGKGSVTMMITELLREAGYKTAHHTSPFLQSPTEKLVYDGRWEKPSYCVELFNDFDRLHREWQASQTTYPKLKYGEAWVALTFWWMAKRQVEWGIIETGVGGRFDPTTWVTPRVSVITNIALDHIKTLGPTLQDIAWHKAGIIKPNVPAVVGVTQPDLLVVFEQEAIEKNANLYRLGQEFDFKIIDGDRITVYAPNRTYTNIKVGALGQYQLVNAALAIATVDIVLEGKIPQSSFTGFARATYPGRMEIMPDDQLVMIDGAHNPHKMEALVNSIKKRYPDKGIVALVGGLMAKDLQQTFKPLVSLCRHMVVSQPQLVGKKVNPPEAIAQMLRELDPNLSVQVEPELQGAIAKVKALATNSDLVLITGSIYLIGQARNAWYPLEQLLLDSEIRK